ncbi:unnamed protein product [Amoebophrya sp. A25]|nr:unnamed protein product [Amoebophrya sp. A25]|eukprot:GSA25T00025184001.1
MLRGGFGASGQQQSQDCAFEALQIRGTPIRVSYFLVVMFLYQVFEAVQQSLHGGGNMPFWFPVAYAAGSQILLFATILCHEFGHGTMAQKLGGEIAQILLWPFGGICFSTRPSGVEDARHKLRNELKIVVAGPATHFLQAPFWVLVLFAQLAALGGLAAGSHKGQAQHAAKESLLTGSSGAANTIWPLLVPFQLGGPAALPMPLFGGSWILLLLWQLCAWAVTLNVYLFLFNVFFPMYPMDSAQILVCSMQLCGGSALLAAKVLIGVSVPVSFVLIYYAWSNRVAGGVMVGITAYLAIMCLVEAWNIRQLMLKRQLHTHRLFELARSNTMWDSRMGARRINNSNLDDDPNDPATRPPTPTGGRGSSPNSSRGPSGNVLHNVVAGGAGNTGTNYVLFEGRGERLGQGGGTSPPSSLMASSTSTTASSTSVGPARPVVPPSASTSGGARTTPAIPPFPASGNSTSTDLLGIQQQGSAGANRMNAPPPNAVPAVPPAGAPRQAFLQRLERDQNVKSMTVRQLEEQRLAASAGNPHPGRAGNPHFQSPSRRYDARTYVPVNTQPSSTEGAIDNVEDASASAV